MSFPNLPPAELDVLSVLWQRGESTARDVREALVERRPMSHGAVFALITRLEEKGLVGRSGKKIGKAFLYRAKVKPNATLREKAGDLMERLFAGSSVALVSSLFETRPPSLDEIRELEKLLAEHKKARKAEDRS